jgi:hypothetical protein
VKGMLEGLEELFPGKPVQHFLRLQNHLKRGNHNSKLKKDQKDGDKVVMKFQGMREFL